MVADESGEPGLCLEAVVGGGIRGVGLELAPGSLTVLLGATGAGKTSLLRLMAGLDAPAEGRVRLGAADVHRLPPRRRRVGLVHQRFTNYPGKTVYENIAAPLRQGGATDVDRKVHAVAELLRIDGLLGRRPAELSGGQQQRTALARALVKDGGLLLLDEPLVNLDYKLREELGAELRAIFGRRSATLVYATSDPAEALALGGDLVVLENGGVLQRGPALEVYRRPCSLRVAELTSVPPMSWVAGHVAAGRLHLDGGAELPAAQHLGALAPGDYRFGVRPHQLRLLADEPAGARLPATVELAELSGSETFLHVRLDGPSGARLVLHQAGTRPREIGERLVVVLPPEHLYAFDPAGRLVAAPEA